MDLWESSPLLGLKEGMAHPAADVPLAPHLDNCGAMASEIRVQCRTAQYCTVLCGTMQYSTAECSAVQYCANVPPSSVYCSPQCTPPQRTPFPGCACRALDERAADGSRPLWSMWGPRFARALASSNASFSSDPQLLAGARFARKAARGPPGRWTPRRSCWGRGRGLSWGHFLPG